jgi:hypothetical protein
VRTKTRTRIQNEPDKPTALDGKSHPGPRCAESCRGVAVAQPSPESRTIIAPPTQNDRRADCGKGEQISFSESCSAGLGCGRWGGRRKCFGMGQHPAPPRNRAHSHSPASLCHTTVHPAPWLVDVQQSEYTSDRSAAIEGPSPPQRMIVVPTTVIPNLPRLVQLAAAVVCTRISQMG